MTVHVVTGGTGFLGRHVLPLLLAREDCTAVHVLVRESSLSRLEQLTAQWDGGDKLVPLVGDLTARGLGLGRRGPRTAGHVLHLGAVYDMTAPEEASRAANVEGTRSVIALATRVPRPVHRVRLRPRPTARLAVSPHQVRGRGAGPGDLSGSLAGVPAERDRRALRDR